MTMQDHFHGCPQCPTSRGPDRIYNAGRLHRGACHTHRTTWVLGSWRPSSGMTEAQQRERWREIEEYEDVDVPGVRYRGEAA